MSVADELEARITPIPLGLDHCQSCSKDVRQSYVYRVGEIHVCLACFRSRGSWANNLREENQ